MAKRKCAHLVGRFGPVTRCVRDCALDGLPCARESPLASCLPALMGRPSALTALITSDNQLADADDGIKHDAKALHGGGRGAAGFDHAIEPRNEALDLRRYSFATARNTTSDMLDGERSELLKRRALSVAPLSTVNPMASDAAMNSWSLSRPMFGRGSSPRHCDRIAAWSDVFALRPASWRSGRIDRGEDRPSGELSGSYRRD